MPKVSPLQSDFSGGEFSPLLYGRLDSERYKSALALVINYISTLQGPLTRRPGTKYAAGTKVHANKSRLIPFEFSTTQAYIIETGEGYFRFYKDNGQILEAGVAITGATQANPVVITSVAHGLSTGQEVYISGVLGMTQLNGKNFKVTVLTADTYSLQDADGTNVNGTTYTAYSSAGTGARVYTVANTYLTADLFDIYYTQSADILYLAHPNYAPRKLTRTGHTTWTLTTIDFLDGPYLPTNTTTTTLQPSGGAPDAYNAGSTGVTLTASSVVGINDGAGFAATDVGRLIRMQEGAVWGYVKITGWTSTTVVTVTIIKTLTDATTKAAWRLGLYSATYGYPTCVVFHEDRLFWAGAGYAPQRLDGSCSGDYENFEPSPLAGGVPAANNAVGYALNANDVNAIKWMASDEKALVVGTLAAEWPVRPSIQSEALSPSNITAKKSTSWGSEGIRPVQIGKATMYIQRGGKAVRELSYFSDVDGFRAPDLTVLANHISAPSITEIAYQKTPQSILWAVRSDGVLLGMTYERDFDALRVGWHRHILGGVSDAANTQAIVESCAVIPSSDGTRDEVWLIVRRRINGVTRRTVEYMTKIFEETDLQRDAFFVDCGLTYDVPKTITAATTANPVVVTSSSHGFSNGDYIRIHDVKGMSVLNDETFLVANVAANTFELSGVDGTAYTPYVSGGTARKLITNITGLDHLEGLSVDILADGAVQTAKTVTGGAITLDARAGTVQIGLGYRTDGQILRPEGGSETGTSLGKTRRIHLVSFLLHRSLGLKFGLNFDEMDTMVFRTSSDPLTRAVPLFSGLKVEELDADYNYDNQICWRQDQPLPSTILAIAYDMVVQDRG